MKRDQGWFMRRLDRSIAKDLGLSPAEVRHELRASGRAWDALADGQLDQADALAGSLLDKVAARDPFHGSDHWHAAHLVLGHVCLRRGDLEGAEAHLLAAARVDDPSPALCSFGPNMSLSRALVERDRVDVVIDYLDACSSFWKGLSARH